MTISDDTLKNILIYIYDQHCMAPNDSLRDIINESLEHEEISLYTPMR